MIPGIVTLIRDNFDIIQGKPESESAIKSGPFKSQAMFNLSSCVYFYNVQKNNQVEVSNAVGDYTNSQNIKFNTNPVDRERLL